MSWVLSLSILLSICRVYIYVRLNIYMSSYLLGIFGKKSPRLKRPLGWPWVGEFVGFIIILTCFPTQHNLVYRKHPIGRTSWIDSLVCENFYRYIRSMFLCIRPFHQRSTRSCPIWTWAGAIHLVHPAQHGKQPRSLRGRVRDSTVAVRQHRWGSTGVSACSTRGNNCQH